MSRSFLHTGSLRLGFLAVLAVGLGGCSIPTPVSIATYAVDGASYAMTGKSMSDHALSAVLEQDCAMLRVVQGRLVCREVGDTSDEEIRQALADAYGLHSPLNTPYPVVPSDSVEAVGEHDGLTLPRDEHYYLERLPREQRLVGFGPRRVVASDN